MQGYLRKRAVAGCAKLVRWPEPAADTRHLCHESPRPAPCYSRSWQSYCAWINCGAGGGGADRCHTRSRRAVQIAALSTPRRWIGELLLKVSSAAFASAKTKTAPKRGPHLWHRTILKGKMVGDPGIEPGMSLLGGVTVRCRTLQHVARRKRGNTQAIGGRQGKNPRKVHFPRKKFNVLKLKALF